MLAPEERQKIYEEEKARIEAQDKVRQEQQAKQVQQGCWVLAICFLVCGGLGLMVMIAVGIHEYSSSTKSQTALRVPVTLATGLTYEVVDEEVSDTPGKIMIKQFVVVKDNATVKTLDSMLRTLHADCMKRRGFKHGAAPSVVAIRAYASRQHLSGGEDQWLATLSMTPPDSTPRVTVKEDAVAALREKPVEKFGLSEAQRRQICTEIVLAEDRAWKQAEKLYPLNIRVTKDALDSYSEARNALSKKYRDEVYATHGLTVEQGRSIGDEGLKKGWPMPKH